MTSTMDTAEGADLGVIGLGVMGENLALNVTDHGFSAALARPRRILLMIKAGAPVDEMLEKLAAPS